MKKYDEQHIEDLRHAKMKDLRTKNDQILKIANLTLDGKGSISREDLPKRLRTNNGGQVRGLEPYFIIERRGDTWNFLGFREQTQSQFSVPQHIRALFKDGACVVLDTHSQVSIDHKYYPYTLYDNPDFNKDPNHYQPLHITLQNKKREDKKDRENTGYKPDNRKYGCAFSTTRYTLKDRTELYTTTCPYDGYYLTDPKETLRQDRQLYTDYYNALSAQNPNLSLETFEQHWIPKINNAIREDKFIQNIHEVCEAIINN